MTLTLYHGSKTGIDGDIRPCSRACCDFGCGFYLGTEKTQPQTLICNRENPRMYVCELEIDGLRVHRFESSIEWAMFIAWNRGLIPDKFVPYYEARFKPIVSASDVIVGRIADDRMVVVLDWFFNDFISDVGLLESLKALNLGDQYVCKTSAACRNVRILEERMIRQDECSRWKVRAGNQRDYALKVVDRIRVVHRRDGEAFSDIMERETGLKRYDS